MTDTRRPSDPSEPADDALSLEEEQELLRALASAQAQRDEGRDAHDRAWAKALAAETTAAPKPDAAPAERAGMAADDHGDFVEALRAAHAPAALEPARHVHLLQKVVTPARRRVRPATWAASGLALAAAVLLALRFASDEGRVVARPEAELSRSTESIVASASAAGASTRIDRIAQARSGDYRKNRFRSWGAR